MVRRRTGVGLLAGAAAAVVLVAGCGSSTKGNGAGAADTAGGPGPATPSASVSGSMSGMPTTPANPGSSSPGDPAVATASVRIASFAFSPATITVRVGTTVTWTNADQEPHTVSARDRTFSSPAMNDGATYQYTFRTPGTYAYLCTIHPFMTATVVVTR